jgi:uncharacterized protein with GYD domain
MTLCVTSVNNQSVSLIKRSEKMALSMVQFSYSSEIVGNLIKNPEDRSIAVKNMIEKLGGKMLAFYYCFGEYDGVVIADMPDNISGLATNMISYASGASTKLKTTILIKVEEAMAAMKKATGIQLAMPKS